MNTNKEREIVIGINANNALIVRNSIQEPQFAITSSHVMAHTVFSKALPRLY